MRKTCLTLAALMLAASLPLSAQQRRMTAAERRKAEQEAREAQQRIDMMTAATQRVTFIDSMVVDKEGFLAHYKLGVDAGSLQAYADFFGTPGGEDATVYVNELGDMCIYAEADTTGSTALYARYRFDGSWSEPKALMGMGGDKLTSSLCYPFLMPDGATLYFAAKGSESIGGYDIFVTRFDSENGQFLRAENIGMPFNSTANDYMYAIDEYNSIGWFVTDRRQPEGKVCIYTFIPTATRETYSPEQCTDEQLRSLAALDRIADTWGDGEERQQALNRLKRISTTTAANSQEGQFAFVVADDITYTKMSDFRHPQGAARYKRLTGMRNEMAQLQAKLDKARASYEGARGGKLAALRSEILSGEQRMLSLQEQARQLEKDIISAEHQAR